jgi:hypothetical protein
MTPNDYTDGRTETAVDTQDILVLHRDGDEPSGAAIVYLLVVLAAPTLCGLGAFLHSVLQGAR